MNSIIFFVVLGISASFADLPPPTVSSVGNGFYNLYFDSYNGLFTAATGSSHSSGAGNSVLYGGDRGDPLTSYVSLHSYDSGVDYVTSEVIDNGTLLRPDANTLKTFANGWEIQYPFRGSVDNFNLTVLVFISGTTEANTVVYWSAKIYNADKFSRPINFGLRFLFDYEIGTDDGPVFATVNPDSARYAYEREWPNPTYEYYANSANSNQSKWIEVCGAGAGPVPGGKPVSRPTNIKYTQWTKNYRTPFEYTVDPNNDVAYNGTGGIEDDSSVLVFFGDKVSNSYRVNAGQSVSFNTSIFARLTLNPADYVVTDACNDHHTCTYDYTYVQDIYNYECIYVKNHKICDDNNNCTIDSCDTNIEGEPGYDSVTGCRHTQKDCNDGLDCTKDSCNATTGQCIHEVLSCDDKIKCTHDYCDEELGYCFNNPNTSYCGDLHADDKCNNWFCDPLLGCVSEEISCDDHIHCTVDTCNPTSGCVHTVNNTVCDDGISCTDNYCDVSIGKCVAFLNDSLCNDNNNCTNDFCTWQGCKATPVDCADEIKCTQDSCGADGTCLHTPLNSRCDDNVTCTVDTCDIDLGECTNIPFDDLCDDNQNCTIDSCSEKEGCSHTVIDCDDQISCTFDYCDFATQKCVHSVANETTRCDDGISCTHDFCNLAKGSCDHTVNHTVCDDGDLCTDDHCDVPFKQCIHTPKVCKDEVHCTLDQCVNGTCVFTPRNTSCDDNVTCTIDICDEFWSTCTNTPHDSLCDDNVWCTVDTCNSTGCDHELVDDRCDDNVECTTNVCTATGCVTTAHNETCDDGLDCTLDICDPHFGCIYVARNSMCDDTHDCTTDICDLTYGCYYTPDDTVCDDNITCTEDVCTEDGCANYARDSLCNDNVGCTIDTCDVGLKDCVHTTNDSFCSDGRECSIEVCDYAYGCIMNDTSCATDTKLQSCINCHSSKSRIGTTLFEDGYADLILQTRNAPITEFGIASATKDLTNNVVVKGTGEIVFGDEEYLDVNDLVVVGAHSTFRVVPSEDSLRECTEITRGLIQIAQEQLGVDKVDQPYICLRNEDDSHTWRRLTF